MPTDSAPTRKAILQSAKEQFLEKGFSGAQVRAIAAGAGVTTGALYQHYQDKYALFQALVNPVCQTVIQRFTERTNEYMIQLKTEGMEPMWNSDNFGHDLASYIYDHFDIFRLLLGVGELSFYEEFVHRLIDLEITATTCYLTEARQRGYLVRIPAKQELHMLASAQLSAFFELVSHNVPRKQGLRYVDTILCFFTAGWKAVLHDNRDLSQQ